MLSKLLGTITVQRVLLIGYSALAIGLPLNKIVLSLATILVALITLLDFNKKDYYEKIKGSKLIQILFIFLFFHLLSYFWSENSSYFLKDLNVKLPFYVLPFVFVLKPIHTRKELYIILGSFLLSLFVTSLINFIVFYSYHPHADTREMSLFLSHIRYGLMLVFGITICYYWFNLKESKYKYLPLLLISWWLIYIYFSQVFSAYVALLIIILFLSFQIIKSTSKLFIKRSIYFLLFGLIGTISSIFIYYFFIDVQPYPLPKKHERTAKGNFYDFNEHKKTFINQVPVYTYYCDRELKQEWAKVSKKGILDKNPSGFENLFILIQYMASKGFLKKDAQTFQKLSAQDIKNIENGIHNCCPEKNSGFIKRIKTLREEVFDSEPNGKTVRQRIEYLKAGVELYKSYPFFGVGSGDLADVFSSYYQQNNSRLSAENQLRTHNQIFTYFISFGLIGGLIFVYLISISFQWFARQQIQLATCFLIIMVLSFLSEDTLETQMGATFFGLYYGLFISSKNLLTPANET